MAILLYRLVRAVFAVFRDPLQDPSIWEVISFLSPLGSARAYSFRLLPPLTPSASAMTMSRELMSRSLAELPSDFIEGTMGEDMLDDDPLVMRSMFTPPALLAAVPKATGPPPISSATDKPETLMQAFEQFRIPRELRLAIMSMMGATSEDVSNLALCTSGAPKSASDRRQKS